MSDPVTPPVAPEPYQPPQYAQPEYAQPVYGQAPAYGQAPSYGQLPAARPTNTLAIVSLVLSLVGLVLPVALGGIITGHIALGQLKRTGENGRGFALAGVIVGYCIVGLSVLGIIAYVILIVVLGIGAAGASQYSDQF